MVNRVFLVEEFVYRVEKENYQPSEDEVKKLGELLGQPTKKLSVLLDRYWQVFTKYIEKRCSSLGSQSICIYSWKVNVPFRVFPLALHASGTVILFEGDRPLEVLAYPFNKPLSYGKSPGVPEEECGDVVPREVSMRVDGWHLTAYYNPLIKRWVFATRYVLHNMYFRKGKLVEEPLDSVANPYVIVADKIAERDGLYEALDKYKGWTFTFVLEGPEPAITRPPHPLGSEVEKYKLYSLMARGPDGKLYTWAETARLLGYRAPGTVEAKPVKSLYEDVKNRLDTRSYFAYVDSGDPENPLILELESQYYAEAMNVKYLYDAKSAAILVSEGLGGRLAGLLESTLVNRVLELGSVYSELERVLSRAVEDAAIKCVSGVIVKATRKRGVAEINANEVIKNLIEGNYKRVAKKAVALLLSGLSLATKEPTEVVSDLVKALRECVEPTLERSSPS